MESMFLNDYRNIIIDSLFKFKKQVRKHIDHAFTMICTSCQKVSIYISILCICFYITLTGCCQNDPMTVQIFVSHRTWTGAYMYKHNQIWPEQVDIMRGSVLLRQLERYRRFTCSNTLFETLILRGYSSHIFLCCKLKNISFFIIRVCTSLILKAIES